MTLLRFVSQQLPKLFTPIESKYSGVTLCRPPTFAFLSSLTTRSMGNLLDGPPRPSLFAPPASHLHVSAALEGNSFSRMHRTGPLYKKRKKEMILDGRPQMKGVVLRTLIKKPKKPNSANRKCVLVRLSNGKEATAFVPGVGHNLQEHNVVLVQHGRLQDTPGVKLSVIRGKYDCDHVKKPTPR